MSKKRKNKKHLPPKRDFKPIANPRLLKAPRIPVILNRVQDFRRDSFPLTRARAYRLLDATPATPASKPYGSLYPRVPALSRLANVLPKEAVVCARRAVRREVIFATGSGGRRGRKSQYHKSETSNIHCRK